MTQSIYDFTVNRLDGSVTSLQAYQGKVLLIVNTASQCGFTPQYAGLQALYQKYATQGFEILAFPCNQFGKQEPGSSDEIADFCETNYQVSFPIFAKIEVNGNNPHPLYTFLKARAKGVLGTETIKWNFTKFLVNRQGEVVKRFAPATKPEAIKSLIEHLLAE